ETVTASQAGTVSNLFKELGGRIAEERYDDPTFTVNLLIKDVRLAVEMARGHDAPPILGRIVEFINESARSQGFGDADTSIMWKLFGGIWDGRKDPIEEE
ncbi:MAG: NAD-binding protein, partial [Deltaproteobacteria bacterium]|nr:NAD-binding protein [Deltaproteobacteria bacterium]